jgi:hypothetical protein
VVLALGTAMLLSLAVGVFASSILGSGRASVALTFTILLFLTIGIPFIGEELLKIPVRSKLAGYVYMVCPWWTLALCMQPGVTVSAWEKYWIGIAGMHGLAWTSLVGACFLTGNYWRDVPEPKWLKWCRAFLKRVQDRIRGTVCLGLSIPRSILAACDARQLTFLVLPRAKWVGT